MVIPLRTRRLATHLGFERITQALSPIQRSCEQNPRRAKSRPFTLRTVPPFRPPWQRGYYWPEPRPVECGLLVKPQRSPSLAVHIGRFMVSAAHPIISHRQANPKRLEWLSNSTSISRPGKDLTGCSPASANGSCVPLLVSFLFTIRRANSPTF